MVRFSSAFLAGVLLVGCVRPASPPQWSKIETPAPALDPTLAPTHPVPTATVTPTPRPSPVLNPVSYPYVTPSPIAVQPYEAAGWILNQGRPLGGIRVSLINNSTWKTYSLTTGADGAYRQSELPEGDYFIHYYNDSDNAKIGFWKTLNRHVDGVAGASFPAIELYLVGMRNTPGQGGTVALPFTFEWTPYQVVRYMRFRVHDIGGPGGRPLYISERLDPDAVSFSYDGTINQAGWNSTRLAPGTRYLWGIFYDAGDSGEGGNLYQDFVSTGAAPRISPTTSPTVSPRPFRAISRGLFR